MSKSGCAVAMLLVSAAGRAGDVIDCIAVTVGRTIDHKGFSAF